MKWVLLAILVGCIPGFATYAILAHNNNEKLKEEQRDREWEARICPEKKLPNIWQ
jgi:hypothetical protein